MANTITSWSSLVSSSLTNTAATDTGLDAETAADIAEEKAQEAALVAAAPGSSTELFNLFASLPPRSDTEVQGANDWLADVTLPTIPVEYQQDDD